MKGWLFGQDAETIRTPTGTKVHLGYLAAVRAETGVAFFSLGCGITVDYPDAAPTDEPATCQPCIRSEQPRTGI